MSRWHDATAAGLARWGNLPLEDRVADRLADILVAASDILFMLEIEGRAPHAVEQAVRGIDAIVRELLRRLPTPGHTPSRPDDVTRALDEFEETLSSKDRAALRVDELARIFYLEIKRLERLMAFPIRR